MEDITYYQKGNEWEWVYYQDATQTYPMHTHAKHIILGYMLAGEVRIISGGEARIYHTGEYYCVMPDTPHAVETVNDMPYSMISVCLSADQMLHAPENEITYTKKLKQFILETPEEVFTIADMARSIGVSPYHMIRQFKAACGLTPHQFQIQCRVRKAQKLLCEEGKSVAEAAYATGFCDQSHFDRCFHKIVRLTPSAYRQSVKRLGQRDCDPPFT